MLGIWFNHDDLDYRTKKHENAEFLKDIGFTHFYVLIKGIENDIRNTAPYHERVRYLVSKARSMGIKAHGVFICSEDAHYLSENPEKADISYKRARSTCRISHVDECYRAYLKESILTAVEEFGLDGVQLDFLRFGYVGNGWGKREEEIYASFGVRVEELRKELTTSYDPSKPQNNLGAFLKRLKEGDAKLTSFSKARSFIIQDFAKDIADCVHSAFPDKEVSLAMMPEAFYPEWQEINLLHYGQDQNDLKAVVDRLFPMAYAGVYNVTSDWVKQICEDAAISAPDFVVGLDCIEPRGALHIQSDLQAVSGLTDGGICLFRYGRMILAKRSDDETELLNTYAGTVDRLILVNGNATITMEVELLEAGRMSVHGHWELIRAYGSFSKGSNSKYEGELCVVQGWDLSEWRHSE